MELIRIVVAYDGKNGKSYRVEEVVISLIIRVNQNRAKETS